MPKAKKTSTLKSFVPMKDRQEIVARAHRVGLSVSQFLHRVALNTPLPDPSRHGAVRDLAKVNADQARLGNLLKLALDDETGAVESPEVRAQVQALIRDIRETQAVLKAQAHRVARR